MAMRTMLVCAILALGCASNAWPQGSSFYFPRYISQPLSPTSHEACTALREDYDQEASRVSKAHDDCLKANTTTAHGDEHGTCAHPRCQGLHDQRDKLSQKRSAAVDQCRNDVAHSLDGKRRDEANRQAAEAERRAREADQSARAVRRQDEQQRREREAAAAQRKRDEQRGRLNRVKKGLEMKEEVSNLPDTVQDPVGTLKRKLGFQEPAKVVENKAKTWGDAAQDAIGTALLGDSSRDPEKDSVHEFILDQANDQNAKRQAVTNPFAYQASQAALRQTGWVQAGALAQWDEATGDLKALDTDTLAGANPFASTLRPLPSPSTGTQSAEVAPAGASPTPSRATPLAGKVLAGSSPPAPAPSSNPFASSAGAQSVSGPVSIGASPSPQTEAAAHCFYHHSYKSKVCLGVPDDPQRDKSCWLHEGTLMCPQRLYERERAQALGQRPAP
jgi:hypothetical protein